MTTSEAGQKGGNANTPLQQLTRSENGKKAKGKPVGAKDKAPRKARSDFRFRVIREDGWVSSRHRTRKATDIELSRISRVFFGKHTYWIEELK